jgi:hypothetical protein
MSNTKQVVRETPESSVNIGGWVTIVHRKFLGYDHKRPIHINGTNYTYFPKKYGKPSFLARFKHNLLNTDGRDWMHAQVYTNTSAGTQGANYIALSNDAGGAAAAHTTLASEISTNGLGRAIATTLTHTDDTNATSLSKTFTASGTQSAQLSGLFNASSSGILVHEATMTSASLVSGDTLAVTWSLTLG